MYWTFKDLRIGQMFHFDGEDYVKQSNRTARRLISGHAVYLKQTDGPVHHFAW
jgi:hypothetical protein